MRTRPFLRRLLLILLAAGGLLLVSLLGYREGERRALAAHTAQAGQRLELLTQTLDQRIERYRALPQLLALDPELRQALTSGVDDHARARLNQRLAAANRTTRASTLTLIDSDGTAIAASNWDAPGSNVGEDYTFRPYVQQAMREGSGRFYGIGVTTGVPGYFLSEAVRDDSGRAVGVVVIKLELAAIENTWPADGDIVLASDNHGVVFLANDDAWRYRMLDPLDDAVRTEVEQTRQYEGQRLRAYDGHLLRETGTRGALVEITSPPQPGRWIWLRDPVADTDWTLHLLHDAAPVSAIARGWAAIAAACWTALVFLALLVQQRLRLASLRRRSRAELETMVRHHAQELRSARDGLVTAAQEADTGLSKRLEHLPQGVVIIDAELRIVAWNSRYIELFRFPPDLVQVGTPIEEVFRYNARRGLLGPGPVEDAIARRLGHLRSRKAHLRESEKQDGTVLEIRGNPLPDGGFVTSYADITAYKAAARELRTLADALERRIAERTADLEQARAEAEAANRYKGRFAAAAVHDLLQPLNAARMFSASLRPRLHDPDSRRLAANIDNALAAQDGILSSLLDISRLETGTLPTEPRDLALGPLLDGLARETAVLARARGLTFDHVPTRVHVHSDPTLLRRLVQNFLSNAVRYTASGRIVLGVRREDGQVWIEVHDTGPGIAPNRQREIFEEFRRLDDGRDASDRGAGLGLAIVERIARRLGHRIDLRSKPGRGSVFRVAVARVSADATSTALPSAAEEDAPLRGCRVWVVDSLDEGATGIATMLQRWECEVVLAGRADTARGAAVAGSVPDIVLLDARIEGAPWQALWDELCGRWQATPLLVLLADGPDAGLRERAREAGHGFLARPLRAPALRALLSQMRLRGR